MKDKILKDKTTTIALAVVIFIAVIALIYVNLPESEKTSDDSTDNDAVSPPIEEIILTVSFDDQQFNYTFSELENMTSYTGLGGKIDKKSITTGPYNYTGVKITTLLDKFENLPENYNITATSSDDYSQSYTKSTIEGNITLYNDTNSQLNVGDLTVIVAYKIEDEYITDPEYSPIMIAAVDSYYTQSNLWARMLVSLEIVEI